MVSTSVRIPRKTSNVLNGTILLSHGRKLELGLSPPQLDCPSPTLTNDPDQFPSFSSNLTWKTSPWEIGFELYTSAWSKSSIRCATILFPDNWIFFPCLGWNSPAWRDPCCPICIPHAQRSSAPVSEPDPSQRSLAPRLRVHYMK